MADQAVSPRVLADQVTVSSSTPTTVLVARGLSVGIQIKSLSANTGLIYLGDSNVDATKCYPLNPGESIFLPLADTTQLKALAAVDGEKIHFVVF